MSDTESPQLAEPAAPVQAATPEDDSWRKLVPLLAVTVAAVVLAAFTGALPILLFVFCLIAIIMLHEFGHFITAKWSGMKVTEYFLGFGPRLWSVRRGETEYGIKAIPAGGYVKIIGMSNIETDVDPADEPRTYRQQPYSRRMAVALAGIAVHLVIAFLLLMLIWTVIGVPRAVPTREIGSVSRLETGPSPAEQAGFKVGDKLVSVNGEAVRSFDDVPPLVRRNPGIPMTFVVERDGQPVTLTPTPARENPEGERVGFLGIGPVRMTETERANPVVGAGRAARDVGVLTWHSVRALGSFFAPGSIGTYTGLLAGDGDGSETNRPLSPYGAARLASQAADEGVITFIYLLVVLNLFIALFNAVPLPPLDGGHVAIATYERIRSRRGKRYFADVQRLMPIAAAVVAVLLTLGATSLWLDITNPADNPFQ